MKEGVEEGRGLLLSPRATLMPISDLVDFEEDEGWGKGERQNMFSMYIRVSVAWGCMSLSSLSVGFFLCSYEEKRLTARHHRFRPRTRHEDVRHP